MGQFGTIAGGLPVPTGTGTGYSPYRGAARAPFLSQLIAERQHLPPQRARRQAPVAEVLRTYDAGGRLSVRRLPPGYRISISA